MRRTKVVFWLGVVALGAALLGVAQGAANDVELDKRNAADTGYVPVVLADPGADSLMMWDESGNSVVYSAVSGYLATGNLDTFAELDALVADVSLLHDARIDSFAELDALVADVSLLHDARIDTLAELNAIITDATLLDGGAAGAGAFSDAADPVVLNSPAKDVVVGVAAINAAKLSIDGDADQVLLALQAHTTQTARMIDVEDDAGAMLFSLDPTGVLALAEGIDAVGAGALSYGSVDVTGHAFYTDGTGDAELILPAGSVSGTEIAGESVTSANILDETVTAADVADDTLTVEQMAYNDWGAFTITNNVATLDAGSVNAAALASGAQTDTVTLVCSATTGDLTTGAKVARWVTREAITITGVYADMGTAPTVTDVEVDINKNGVSILSTVISVDVGDLDSEDSTTPAAISTSGGVAGDEYTVDIEVVGATGTWLQVTIEYTH